MWTDGRMDRHDEANSRFLEILGTRLNKKKDGLSPSSLQNHDISAACVDTTLKSFGKFFILKLY
jgi:hypothetical protein